MPNCPCCNNETALAFQAVVLKKYEAKYYDCPACGSLHVPKHPWLAEAYGNTDWSDSLDSGAAWRNSAVADVLRILAKEVPEGRWLDYGSGQGLLSQQFENMHSFDLYRATTNPTPPYCIITCIEVLEHSADPLQLMCDLVKLLHPNGLIVLSTWLRTAQHCDLWEYLALEGGQHITFPSHKGLRHLCESAKLKWICSAVSQTHEDLQIHILSPMQNMAIPVFSVG